MNIDGKSRLARFSDPGKIDSDGLMAFNAKIEDAALRRALPDTKRIVGRVTASQMAWASAASFLPRLT